jgi:hypothetical protein
MPEMRRKHGPELSRRVDRYLAAMARMEGPRGARLSARCSVGDEVGRGGQWPHRFDDSLGGDPEAGEDLCSWGAGAEALERYRLAGIAAPALTDSRLDRHGRKAGRQDRSAVIRGLRFE